FDQAIALDPRYALAYAARGESFFDMGDLILPMSEAKPKAKQDIAVALSIDDKLVEARTILANIEFQYDWDFARAEQDFKQVISARIEELEKAKAMEPTPLVIGQLSYAYAKAGRKDEARKLLAELKELSKRRYVAPYWIAMIHVGLSEKDEAFAWLEKAYQER